MRTFRSLNKSDEVEESDEMQKLTVETSDNHIYFYAYVDSDRCLALIKSIRELDQQLRNERLTRDLPDHFPNVPIWLHINSGGGNLFDGLGMADQLGRIKTPIYSVVEGYCASAATLISMSCTRRYIMPSAYVLIHQLSAATWGTYQRIKDETHLLDMAMDRLVAFYKAHSGLKTKRIRELLAHDSWFNADECVEIGLVDEVLT